MHDCGVTSRERVLAAVNHEETDRVPFDLWMTPEIEERLENRMGLSGYELFTHLGHDLLMAQVGPGNDFKGKGLKLGETRVSEWGITWKKIQHQYGAFCEIVEHPLADRSRLNSYTIPDPSDEALFADVKELIRKYGREYAVVGAVPCTIFEISWHLAGMDNLLTSMVADKTWVHRLMDTVMEYGRAVGRRLAELGVDIILVGDDVGMQDRMLISPQMWREFLKPRYELLFQEFRSVNPSVKIAYHSDGFLEPILREFIDIGLDILNPVQPKSMDPERLKREFGRNLTLWGGIDNQELLPFGTPSQVESEVRRLIRILGEGGGYILSSSHTVTPETKIENILAFYRAANEQDAGHASVG